MITNMRSRHDHSVGKIGVYKLFPRTEILCFLKNSIVSMPTVLVSMEIPYICTHRIEMCNHQIAELSDLLLQANIYEMNAI